MKTRKRYTIRALGCVAALTLVTGCSSGEPSAPQIEQETVIQAIGMTQGSAVDFHASIPMTKSAVKVVTVCPFQDLQSLKSALGFNWSEASLLVSDDESTNALVFTDGKNVVAFAKLDRLAVNLCSAVPGGTSLELNAKHTFSSEPNTDGSKAWTLKR